jgi:hypothetical protein
METWDFKRKDVQAIFLNPFSSFKRKFVVCPFVDEGKKRKLSVCKWTKRTKRICPSMITELNAITNYENNHEDTV